MSTIKKCDKLTAVALQAFDEVIQTYDDLCGDLSDAIEMAYREGFQDSRAHEIRTEDECWDGSTARRSQP